MKGSARKESGIVPFFLTSTDFPIGGGASIMKRRLPTEQMVAVLRQVELALPVADLNR